MNYKDVVDRIRQVVFDHKMLVDFGYGQISDIKTRAQGDGLDGDVNDADYPYCFLNPQPHVRTNTQITYNFNMILMDMAREEEGDDFQNFLAIQSDCIQYIDDIVARLYYFYKDQPEVQFNYSYTPFYERFQDQLAGATANLSIIVPTNIDNCITPYKDFVLVDEENAGGSSGGYSYNRTWFGLEGLGSEDTGTPLEEGATYRVDWNLPGNTNLELLTKGPSPKTSGIAVWKDGVNTSLEEVVIPPISGFQWSTSGSVEFKVPVGEVWRNPNIVTGAAPFTDSQFSAIGYSYVGLPAPAYIKLYKKQ